MIRLSEYVTYRGYNGQTFILDARCWIKEWGINVSVTCPALYSAQFSIFRSRTGLNSLTISFAFWPFGCQHREMQ